MSFCLNTGASTAGGVTMTSMTFDTVSPLAFFATSLYDPLSACEAGLISSLTENSP